MSQVNKPAHYQTESGMEAIDVIEAFLTPEEARGFRKGNALKYILRSGKKDSMKQDLQKALWYVNREVGNTTQSPSTETREEYFREGRKFRVTYSNQGDYPTGTIMSVYNGMFGILDDENWCPVDDKSLTCGRYHYHNGSLLMTIEFEPVED